MKLVHPAAWAGLILNGCMLYMIYSSLSAVSLDHVPADQRELLQRFIPMLPPALAFFWAVQALAIWLAARGISAGMAVACIFGFMLLPFSLVHMLGTVHTLHNARYASFVEGPPGKDGAVAAYDSLHKQRIWPAAAITTALGLLLITSGAFNFGVMLLCCGVVCAYLGARMINSAALLLYPEHMVVMPYIMSKRILVPYRSIRKATLFADQSIRFDIDTPEGLRELKWTLKSLPENRRREALDQLASALRANNVTLA